MRRLRNVSLFGLKIFEKLRKGGRHEMGDRSQRLTPRPHVSGKPWMSLCMSLVCILGPRWAEMDCDFTLKL